MTRSVQTFARPQEPVTGTLAKATCGHFALFNEAGDLERQVCKCPDPKLPPVAVKAVRR